MSWIERVYIHVSDSHGNGPTRKQLTNGQSETPPNAQEEGFAQGRECDRTSRKAVLGNLLTPVATFVSLRVQTTPPDREIRWPQDNGT
jgi:hypothetical protein